MLKLLSVLSAGAAIAMLTGIISQAGAVPLGGVAAHVQPVAGSGAAGLVIAIGSGKTTRRSQQRSRAARDATQRGQYFTREKILKDYYNGHIPPDGVNGPAIYTYRWFDNAYGGRR